ncbi:MAG: flagellar hook-associated protein FlgK [Gemmatimonadetes bacterium]|nr:flagellar hook-associated protein FlgK [Gemmatimonadota bacterium]
MGSIESILSIARTAMLAQQTAIDTTGHNIANATTPGYTRQTAVLSALDPLRTPSGVFGRGVGVVDVRSARDAQLAQNARTTGTAAEGTAARRDLLAQVESVFGEPSDTGLLAGMDAFWNAWSDLANAPADHTARVTVQRRGDALARQFNTVANQLLTLSDDTRTAVAQDVRRINELVTQIAATNDQILPAESGGHQASDLRDARDRLIDELSTLVPVTVMDRPDGTDVVLLNGMPLVDGNSGKALTLSGTLSPVVRFNGSATPLRLSGGALQARLEILATDLPQAQANLDQLASGLISGVNALHTSGWSPTAGVAGNWDPLAGPTGSGVLFFDPTAATARTMRLSGTVATDAASIASGDALDGTGNNRIALAISALRTTAPTSPVGSFASEYQALIAQVAGAANAATAEASVNSSLASHAKTRLQSAAGVSTDEELVALIRHQQAYAASTRVIETARALYDALMSISR